MQQSNIFGDYHPLRSPCTVAQAISALVKMIRVRKTDDAVYWYHHITSCFPDARFRLYRRLLIIGAEDCLDLATQRKVVEWYDIANSTKNYNKVDYLATYLIQLICSKENWWQSPSGQRYIADWFIADSRVVAYLPQEVEYYRNGKALADIFATAQRHTSTEDRTAEALLLHTMYTWQGGSRIKYATALCLEATRVGNMQVRLTALAHAHNAKTLGEMDDNWIGHALYRLAGNPLEALDIQPVGNTEAVIMSVRHELETKRRTPPAWTQDGIHCAGKDTRFAGILSSMLACCNVYREYGSLGPELEFKEVHFKNTNFD